MFQIEQGYETQESHSDYYAVFHYFVFSKELIKPLGEL